MTHGTRGRAGAGDLDRAESRQGRSLVRWAVIPAAGLGTRMLPATKAIPKEMMPVGDAPLIEHVVREAAGAGITDVVIVTATGKEAMRAHFEPAPVLDAALRARGKTKLADDLRAIEEVARLHWVFQDQPRGLGHAVLCARPAVGDEEPFAVLLPDELFLTAPGDATATAQLVDVFERSGARGAVAAMEVPLAETSRYGIIDAKQGEDGLWQVADLVEKPAPEKAPSRMSLPGRYVLPGRTFAILERTTPGHGGEIQLTDALRVLAHEGGLVAAELRARRIDAGSLPGWLVANAEIALARSDLAGPYARELRTLLLSTGAGR